MTEFALSLPLLFGVGMWGLEAANESVRQMQISQIAVQIADNASRIGDTSTLEDRKIYESDIDDLFAGAQIQGGNLLDLYGHGRVILSSLEVVPNTDDQQYIHWQRCMGTKHHTSSYGNAGDGLVNGLPGIGPSGDEIYALKGEAVMFVEVSYDYQPLISPFFTNASTLTATAAFNVRASRDLSQIYQRDPNNPDSVADCNTYTNPTPVS